MLWRQRKCVRIEPQNRPNLTGRARGRHGNSELCTESVNRNASGFNPKLNPNTVQVAYHFRTGRVKRRTREDTGCTEAEREEEKKNGSGEVRVLQCACLGPRAALGSSTPQLRLVSQPPGGLHGRDGPANSMPACYCSARTDPTSEKFLHTCSRGYISSELQRLLAFAPIPRAYRGSGPAAAVVTPPRSLDRPMSVGACACACPTRFGNLVNRPIPSLSRLRCFNSRVECFQTPRW